MKITDEQVEAALQEWWYGDHEDTWEAKMRAALEAALESVAPEEEETSFPGGPTLDPRPYRNKYDGSRWIDPGVDTRENTVEFKPRDGYSQIREDYT